MPSHVMFLQVLYWTFGIFGLVADGVGRVSVSVAVGASVVKTKAL